MFFAVMLSFKNDAVLRVKAVFVGVYDLFGLAFKILPLKKRLYSK